MEVSRVPGSTKTYWLRAAFSQDPRATQCREVLSACGEGSILATIPATTPDLSSSQTRALFNDHQGTGSVERLQENTFMSGFQDLDSGTSTPVCTWKTTTKETNRVRSFLLCFSFFGCSWYKPHPLFFFFLFLSFLSFSPESPVWMWKS